MEPDSLEDVDASQHRWLLSYGDLVTLLFSLFVVLFASNYASQKKAAELSTGIRQAFSGKAGRASQTSPAAKATARPEPSTEPSLNGLKRLLDDRLARAIKDGNTEIRLENRGLVIHLKDVSFFRPGNAEILPDAYETVDRIANAIAPLPNRITVEGHSDATAIHNSRFQDNWELSSARAVAMLRYLSKMYAIPEQRLSAAAYSDTRPLSDNVSATGRAQNRRVDIVILSDTESAAPPKPAAPAKL